MVEVKITELEMVIRQLDYELRQKKPEPHFQLTVYQDWWSTGGPLVQWSTGPLDTGPLVHCWSTVTFDSLLASSTNIEGAVRQMVLETGELTYSSPGCTGFPIRDRRS